MRQVVTGYVIQVSVQQVVYHLLGMNIPQGVIEKAVSDDRRHFERQFFLRREAVYARENYPLYSVRHGISEIVQIADDRAFTKNVRTLLNNDHDDSAGMGKGKDTAFTSRWWGELIDARGADGKGTRARYVRVHTSEGMEGEWVRFVEVDVYGQ